MKKNGFVFIESIVVLMIVALSVTMLMSSYTLIARKTKEKENYDKASDKYLLYAIANLGTDSRCNYGVDCVGETPNDPIAVTEFAANKNNCRNTKIGKILYDCEKVFNDMGIKYIYVVKNVRNTLNDYKRNSDGLALDASDNIIKRSESAFTGSVNNDEEDIKRTVKITSTNASDPVYKRKAVSVFDNGTIEYMKTLKKCNDENEESTRNGDYFSINRNKETYICEDSVMYIIGVFERGDKLYYAAIDISGGVRYDDTPVESRSQWVCDNCSNTPKPAIKDQIWFYYINNTKAKGLYKLTTGDDVNATNTYYYYLGPDGVMQIGWVKGVIEADKYYLFSPLDYAGNGAVDGRRIQATKANTLKITVNGIDLYVDKKGACYKDANATTPCTSADIATNITSLTLSDWCQYTCNGDECFKVQGCDQ